jgi:L-iditol 2-dehydrogenase
VRAATFYAPGDLRVTDIDEPTAGPRELKLRMHATATCGTDAKIYKHGHPRLEPPQVIGHELAGEVVEVGARSPDTRSGTACRSSRRCPAGSAGPAPRGR